MAKTPPARKDENQRIDLRGVVGNAPTPGGLRLAPSPPSNPDPPNPPAPVEALMKTPTPGRTLTGAADRSIKTK